MKLLVPLDGSAASSHALSHALWLAEQRPDALLILLNVQNAEPLGLAFAAQKSQEILRKPVARCGALQTRCETRAEYGPIGETINRVARETQADQIVMGTRGLGRVRGLLLGSVAAQVVQLADIPVTLVKKHKAPARSRSDAPDENEAAAFA